MIDIEGVPVWLFLLSLIVGGLGWVIRNLHKEITDLNKCVHSMNDKFISKHSFETMVQEVKNGLMRIEQRLDQKLDNIVERMDRKVDRHECYRLHAGDYEKDHRN